MRLPFHVSGFEVRVAGTNLGNVELEVSDARDVPCRWSILRRLFLRVLPGFGFRVSGSGFRVPGFGFRVSDSEFRVFPEGKPETEA